MKLSVSLPASDVALLDDVVCERGNATRSSILHEAVELLRERRLAAEYEIAANEWVASGDAHAWSSTDVDGLDETW